MGAGALRVYLLPSVKQEAEPVSADMASCPEATAELCRAIMIASIHLQDAEMMEQIDRDVMRTHPGLHFFSGDDGAAVTHREVPSQTSLTPPSSCASPLLQEDMKTHANTCYSGWASSTELKA